MGIVILGVIAYFFIDNSWNSIVEKEVHNKIESLGGEVIEINRIDVKSTPFKEDKVGGIYFQIIYEKGGQRKVAYYRRHKSLNIKDVPSKGAPVEWII